MHSCEPVVAPPATGPSLLLELGHLIIRGRQDTPRAPHTPLKNTTNATATHEDALYAKILQAKLLAARSLTPRALELPSTSKELPPRSNASVVDSASVGEAISKAQKALQVEVQLNNHVHALWNEQIPICIEVLMAPDCRECYARLSKVADDAHERASAHDVVNDRILLLERWTLSVFLRKNHETPSFITSQWLLNAVRSQLHFSQISAWHAKIGKAFDLLSPEPPEPKQIDPNERQRKLSRETCNYKKLESNCDDADLPKGTETGEPAKSDSRNLNIIYVVKIPGETYKVTEFTRPPNSHVFPITDIGNGVFLKVTLECLPRVEDIPNVQCSCGQGNLASKRRTSKDLAPLSLHEELTLRMNDLNLGPPEKLREHKSDHFRCKGATFSPDLGVINSNTGSPGGISRKLSIFSIPTSTEVYCTAGSAGVTTLDRQFYNDSGYQDSAAHSPVYRRKKVEEGAKRAERVYLAASSTPSGSLEREGSVRANYPLVDDRMLTPCSESGKHRCSCDDESDPGRRVAPRARARREPDDARSAEPPALDERRLKEIAKYERRLRKESRLRKLRESGTSDSGGASDGPEGGEESAPAPGTAQATSIPILQAARFDRMRTIGRYRNRACPAPPAAAEPPDAERRTASVGTQTEEACACGARLQLACGACAAAARRLPRSPGTYDLAGSARADLLLEAMARTCRLHAHAAERTRKKTRDDSCCDDEKVMKKHKCDNNDRDSLRCDSSGSSVSDRLSDSASAWDETIVRPEAPSSVVVGVRKCREDDDSPRDHSTIIKRPKLKRFFPIVDKIEKIVSDRLRETGSDRAPPSDDSVNSDIDELLLKDDDSVFAYMARSHSTPQEKDRPRRRKHPSGGGADDDDYILYEKCDYGTFDRVDSDAPVKEPATDSDSQISPYGNCEGFKFPIGARRDSLSDHSAVPSTSEMDRFRWRFDSAASMVFHSRTGLPLTSSPAPLRKGKSCFDYDSSITGISGIKSALFHPVSPTEGWWSPGSSPGSPAPPGSAPVSPPPRPAPPALPRPELKTTRRAVVSKRKLKLGPSTGLLGSFEESALKGRLEPVATVHGFTAELGASGAFCPPHRRLPVTVFFYAPGGTHSPYLGHINLGSSGYRVARSGTVQVSLFNPHGTLVKMFVVLYDLEAMPAGSRTFLRQRTLYMPAGASGAPPPAHCYKWLRYLIHLRFLTSKSGKLYLHTDIRIIVSRKADLDAATAHSPMHNAIITKTHQNLTIQSIATTNQKTLPSNKKEKATNEKRDLLTDEDEEADRKKESVNRVFGGCSDQDVNISGQEKTYDYISAKSDQEFLVGRKMNRSEGCMELSTHCPGKNEICDLGDRFQNGQNVSYELRSFTYAPDNPKYSPR